MGHGATAGADRGADGWPTPTPSGGRSISRRLTGRTVDGKHAATLEHCTVKFCGPARLTASGDADWLDAGMESGGS